MAMLAGSYLLLQNSKIQTFIISKITEQLSLKTGAKISVGKVDIAFFNQVDLNDVLITGADSDTIFFTRLASAKIDTLNIRQHKISFSELSFIENRISIEYDSINRFNFTFILDSLRTENKNTPTNWQINCNEFSFNNSKISFSNLDFENEKHFFVDQMDLNISEFSNFADSTAFKINNLKLNYNNTVKIDQMAAEVSVSNGNISVKEMNLKTEKSEINDLNFMLNVGENETVLNKNMEFDVQFSKSTINIAELAELLPSLREMNQAIEISGRIYGKLNDIKGKDIILRSGSNTNTTFDFYINGIEDIETMYLFLDLKQLETTITDVSNFTVIRNGKRIQLKIPEFLYDSDMFSFKGNFSGFLSDFVTFGTLKSKWGTVKTDVSVIPKKDGVYSYRGRISTTNFDIGKLLKIEDIGKITFNGNADGDFKISDKTISGLFKGEISKLEAKQYIYENIKLDGYYKDKMFDGMVSVNDSNLQFEFLGRWDASGELPNFDFNLHADKIVPGKLNIAKNIYQSEIAFNMKAKFTGNKIDNLTGVIIVDDGYYKNKNGKFSLDGIQLISVPKEASTELSFNSSYLDIKVDGIYQFQDIWNSLKSTMNKYVPALNFETSKIQKPNLFDYRIIFKNLDDLTHVFNPDINVETPFLLYGKMDSEHSDFQLEGSIPGFQYKNVWFRNIFVSNKVIDEQYISKIKIREVQLKDRISIHNLAVESEIEDNILRNNIDWYALNDSTGYSSIKSRSVFSESVNTLLPKLKVDFLPSEIFLTDTVWQLDPFVANIDSTNIAIENFVLHNNNQNIVIDGNISKDSTESLTVRVNNIDLANIQKYFSKSKSIKGIFNCGVNVSRIYSQPVFLANAAISNFEYKNQLIGNLALVSSWDRVNSEIDSKLEITNNNRRSLSANGSFNPFTKALDYIVKADSLPLKLLETVISDQFSNFKGTTTATIKIGGTTQKILMDGVAKVSNGNIMIDYTQTNYTVNDVIYFKSDTIQFKNMAFTDVNKNTGHLDGILVHDNFSNMLYDLTINSQKIKVLNTTMRFNEQFYGDAFANCKLKVLGRGLKIRLTGSMTTLPGTAVNISMEYENDIGQYDFLEFVNTSDVAGEDMYFYNAPKTDFTIGFNIEVTPDAKIQLIYNSQIGDIIKGEGEGILLFEMNKYGDISLSGDYTVTKGDYLFTLQSILNKRFTIAPGGTIVWSGDPYNAVIDLSAIYSLKTSLDNLDNYNNANYLYQRIPVECVIVLTDELINPTINFKINFPDENEDIKTRLLQYINTEEELNKQILSLIVLGKFSTPEYMQGQGNFQSQNSNMIGTTASELFSNQLSNWLSQLSKNVDVGFKYRPGNSITNDELELALTTQIFNDRVILNGNIGNNVNPESNNSSQIVGDFDIRVKITPNGKIQLKAYNHSNNDLIYETAPYTQGVGLSFKEEYNSLQELIHKIGSIFKKKEK
ncbi:MAG TPA: translocation/assembly module TamB domain-containing protein [Draconibacterium sp.]|nr:translocation/assembly module TamB domain-containing protein [Draconibacterium sp.]